MENSPLPSATFSKSSYKMEINHDFALTIKKDVNESPWSQLPLAEMQRQIISGAQY